MPNNVELNIKKKRSVLSIALMNMHATADINNVK